MPVGGTLRGGSVVWGMWDGGREGQEAAFRERGEESKAKKKKKQDILNSSHTEQAQPLLWLEPVPELVLGWMPALWA